jgi:hypothetical protein
MIQRLTLFLSFLAVAAAAAGIFLLGGKVRSLSRRVSALEQKQAAPVQEKPAPPPPPAAPSGATASSKRNKIMEIAEKENQDQLDLLARDLALDSRREVQLRAAFIEEFRYYADGVARAVEAMERDDSESDSSLLSEPEFRLGLEERISASDRRVRGLLSPSQTLVFESWRRAIRKERYELD